MLDKNYITLKTMLRGMAVSAALMTSQKTGVSGSCCQGRDFLCRQGGRLFVMGQLCLYLR